MLNVTKAHLVNQAQHAKSEHHNISLTGGEVSGTSSKQNEDRSNRATEGMAERDGRKNSLVVFNLPESSPNTSKGWQKADLKSVAELIEIGTQVERIHMNHAIRLGGVLDITRTWA